jgi:transposase
MKRTGCWSACNTSCSNCYVSVAGRSGSVDENQLFLFAAQIIAAAQAKAAEPGAQESRASGTARRAHVKGHGRKPLPASLERRRVVFDLEEAQRQCRDCQKPMQRIGEDVSERLEFVPASLPCDRRSAAQVRLR